MKRHNCLRMLGALIASFGIGAPSGIAQDGLSIQSAQAVRLTVSPHESSPVMMKTLPEATCVLHAEGVYEKEHQLKLYADDEGIVRFNVRPSAESGDVARFEVDCAADGKIKIYPLHLRSSFSSTADMPPPVVENRKMQAGATVRAALTEDEALNLATEELAKRGYPLRPDRDNAPEAFGTWLKAVTKPSRFVAPRLVARPEVTHSPRQVTNGYSNNWSGYQLRALHYDWVMGEWYVPSVSYEINQHVYSALWIGLDGDGTSDLVQAGTEQESTEIAVFGSHFFFTSYYAWTEFLPLQPTEQVIPNFTVQPGDRILTHVWIGSPGSPTPSLSGSYVIFSVENLERSEHTIIYKSRCAAAIQGNCQQWIDVGGSKVEWIMERPTVSVNGQQTLPDLANYGVSYVDNAYAHLTSPYVGYSFVPYSFPASVVEQIGMQNNTGHFLSGVFPITTSQMQFVWYDFH